MESSLIQSLTVSSTVVFRNIYVTVHAKRYHKSAKIFCQITPDFAFIDPFVSSLQIWGL